jgi:hypothetical protein
MSGSDGIDSCNRVRVVRCTWTSVVMSYNARH